MTIGRVSTNLSRYPSCNGFNTTQEALYWPA